MSHLPERKERNCLNCGTNVFGQFCHVCGQENIEPKETFLHLLNHFINDVTHFDGKFFSSLKLLVTKPGFLSREFMIGRRATYLNPIRMYLFTSAAFFLIFFSLFNFNGIKDNTNRSTDNISVMDSATFSSRLSFKSNKEYDSLLKTGVRKDNWFMRQVIHKILSLDTEYPNNPNEIAKLLIEKFVHRFPQMLFVLLPIFALILKLLYRKKKDYYYADHLIFTLHIYTFVFIVMIVIPGVNWLENLLHWNWMGYISGILAITALFYFYKSLRNFYKERRARTVLKYFIILFLLQLILIILFSFFFFLSFFQI